MVVVAAGRDEGRLVAEALLQLEAEHAAVEVERAVDVGDLEVDVADVDAGVDRLVVAGSPVASPSSASLTRRSASAFCSRRTWRIDQLSKPRERLPHLGVQLAQRRVLDLVLALHLAHDQLRVADQLELARRRARRARSIPSSSARYSATLLVAVPIRSPRSSSTSPSGVAGRRRRSPPGPGCRGRRRRR